MAARLSGSVEGAGEKPAQPIQRLCNEIQLFDLCDLEKCGHKQGLYCTSADLLSRFEAIAEEDERPPAAGSVSDELDDAEATDEEYDDAYDDDQSGDDDYEEDE